MRLFVGLFVLASSSVAAAESYDATQRPAPKVGYVATGMSIGEQRHWQLGVLAEGAIRLDDSPVFARAQIAGGDSGFTAVGGSFKQLRTGVELRGCIVRELMCGFGGVDAGYQYDHPVSQDWFSDEIMSDVAHDLIVVPRAGAELGRTIKLRTAIEMPLAYRLDKSEQRHGFAATAGIAYAF